MLDGSVSPKWIAQVFRQRGIPVPDMQAMTAAISAMGTELHQRLLVAVRSIERGADESDTTDWVRKALTPIGGATASISAPETTVEQSTAAPTCVARGADKGPVVSVVSPSRSTHSNGDPVGAKDSQSLRTGAARHYRKKCRIYGKTSALTIELDQLRVRDHVDQPVHTVLIEAAEAQGNGEFDWERKILFQLTKRELPLLACALMGYLSSALELKNHGSGGEKSLYVQSQVGRIFVKVREGARSILVPVTCSDLYAWTDLTLEALGQSSSQDGTLRLAMLRRVGAMYNDAAERSAGNA